MWIGLWIEALLFADIRTEKPSVESFRQETEPSAPAALALRTLLRQPSSGQQKQHCQPKIDPPEVQIAVVQPALTV